MTQSQLEIVFKVTNKADKKTPNEIGRFFTTTKSFLLCTSFYLRLRDNPPTANNASPIRPIVAGELTDVIDAVAVIE